MPRWFPNFRLPRFGRGNNGPRDDLVPHPRPAPPPGPDPNYHARPPQHHVYHTPKPSDDGSYRQTPDAAEAKELHKAKTQTEYTDTGPTSSGANVGEVPGTDNFEGEGGGGGDRETPLPFP